MDSFVLVLLLHINCYQFRGAMLCSRALVFVFPARTSRFLSQTKDFCVEIENFCLVLWKIYGQILWNKV